MAAPGWFDRDHAGFTQPALNAGLLGVITLLIVPVQMLLVAFAMRGFNQGWNVELERRDPAGRPAPAASARATIPTLRRSRPEPGDPTPHPAGAIPRTLRRAGPRIYWSSPAAVAER